MSTGLLLSLLMNVAAGAYFVWGYPITVRKSFSRGGYVPPLFSLLLKVIPPFGVVLIASSLIYALLLIAGVVQE